VMWQDAFAKKYIEKPDRMHMNSFVEKIF